ncbi:AGE family epimerase/isomerase [Demequina oxidasica]|uniref:AGE family epimerase/isomerase n=1 Tax=Demequina oxidasica TaxID=676199 RepID=UPI0007803081|nr:AGE family epimerase/isomerase [Demequina oxidasica]
MPDNEPPVWIGDKAHARWLEGHADGLLRFGSASAIDVGFGNLNADGRVSDTQTLGYSDLYVTCRMIHSFSLGALQGRPGCATLVDHGLMALRHGFADPINGGWFSSIDAQGPVDRSKQAYSHAFVLLATSSAFVSGRPGAAELMREAMSVHLERFWREDEGMALEGWDEAWTQSEDYRGVNANMHTVEAYLAVADAVDDPAWRSRALTILQRVFGYAADQHWRIPEHFTATWDVLPQYNEDHKSHPFRPFGATGGHAFEWARLALHARAAELATGADEDGVAWLLDGARELFDTAVADSWSVDGAEGFVYTVDFDGVPVVRERMHWVVTEALGAAAALWLATGEVRYAHVYAQWWDHAETYFLDGSGSWIHELGPDNLPSSTVWDGKSDIYHAYQAALIPRLPLAPTLASAVRKGLLDA